MNYYIADLHFGHGNIIRLSNRPYSSVEEMNEDMIKKWNDVVTDQDNVYIVGDFAFRSGVSPVEYLKRLRGIKYLISGNHDGYLLHNKEARCHFKQINNMLTVKDEGRQIVLCHYPLAEWAGFFRQDCYHFYGHIHNNETDTKRIMDGIPKAFNVGIDIIGQPQTADQIIQNTMRKALE